MSRVSNQHESRLKDTLRRLLTCRVWLLIQLQGCLEGVGIRTMPRFQEEETSSGTEVQNLTHIIHEIEQRHTLDHTN